jgi:hypothetical protein
VIEPTTWEQFLDFVNRAGFAWRDLLGQDSWTAWTPVDTGWTKVGTATFTGLFRIVGRQCFAQIKVVPGTTVATVAGTSYIACPIAAAGLAGQSVMFNATTNVAVGASGVDVANSRIHLQSVAASGNTFTIAAWFGI